MMKKLTSMILTGLLCLGLLAGCGGNTAPTTPSETTQPTAQYASALDLLTAIASGMTEEFPAAGGDEAHDTEGAGAYDIGTYGESFQYQILVDQALMDMVEPQAATLMHMMNTNTFCSAVMELKDGQDAESFAKAYQTLVQSNHWMCGFPDTMLVLRQGSYVITAYGADDLIQDFKNSALALGAELLVEAPAEG